MVRILCDDQIVLLPAVELLERADGSILLGKDFSSVVQNIFLGTQVRIMIVLFKIIADLGNFLAQLTDLQVIALSLNLFHFQDLKQLSFLLQSGRLFFLNFRQVSLQSVADRLELVLQYVVALHGPFELQPFNRRAYGNFILHLVTL